MAEMDQAGPGEGAEGKDLRERLAQIVSGLEKEADERIGKRDLIEKRWLADIAQFHGKYDNKILRDLSNSKKSTVFLNQTRQKTNALEARLSDMLFPTDDRNWGIQPTPVPELTLSAEQAAKQAAALKQQAAQNPQDPAAAQRAAEAQQVSAQIQARIDEADKRAKAMTEEIDDNLRQCNYSAQARDVIRDACRIGTGVMKGPVIGGKRRREWQMVDVSDESGQKVGSEWQMTEVAQQRPVYWRVDFWGFFPDMDARSMDDCESVFERHLLNAKQLRRLAKEPGFSEDAIRRLLSASPRGSSPQYIADLRSITGAYHDTGTDRYQVWEYHGPLKAQDLRDLTVTLGEGAENMADDLQLDEVDPLDELNVIIWFCQGEVLKFGVHPLDSADPLYSVFCLERDEASIFGFGVPHLMRDSQKALNAGWRTMLDNAGLSSGPQIVVDEEVIEPANGTWGLEPRKLWKRKPGSPAGAKGFDAFDIPMHQAELANIINLAKQFIDDESGLPMIAQGEQGSYITKTAQGMSILMNSANVIFRRIVKNFDDDMTTPNIRRIYDWLMQFSDKDYIKGDYEIDARGTSVLLVREMQSANLLMFLMNFGAHPTLAGYLKDGGLPALRRLVQTMMIPANELLKSDEDIAQEEAMAAEQPPQPNPEMEKIAAQMNLAQMEIAAKRELALINRETEMLKVAAQMNMTLEQLNARMYEADQARATKERIFAGEVVIEERRSARGQQAASGGYL